MSKRTHRRLAVLAGAAFAVGSMVPASAAINLGGGASADVDVDALALLDDVTGSLPIPALPAIPAIPSLGSLTTLGFGTVGVVNSLVMADATSLLGTVTGSATTLTGAVTGPVTTNVANVTNVLGGIGDSALASVNVGDITANVLTGDILTGTLVGDVLAGELPALPIPALPGLPGLGLLDSLLGANLFEVDVNATGSLNVISALMGSL